jgi:hypothetical protein
MVNERSSGSLLFYYSLFTLEPSRTRSGSAPRLLVTEVKCLIPPLRGIVATES